MPDFAQSIARRLYRVLGWVLVLGSPLSASPTTSRPLPVTSYSWQNVVIQGGGFVTGLLFHPREPGLLYARTDVGGAYRRDSVTGRWQPLNDSIDRENSELLGVVSFAIDPQDPRQLYLACGSYLQDWAKPGALMRSADQGASWKQARLPFKLGGNADGRSMGERLQVDPNDGRILFLGTNQDGLWHSLDQTQNWQRVQGFPASNLTFVLFDAHSGQIGRPTPILFAGAKDANRPALYRSADGGDTWTAVPGQPAGLLVQHAAFDSAGSLFLTFSNGPGPNDTTNGAVWKYSSTDGSWTDITPLRPNPATRDNFSYAGLAVDQKTPGTLMVSTLDRWTMGDEIFRTTDGGTTWRPLLATSTWDSSSAPYTKDFKPHWIGDLAVDPFDSNRALFVTGYGLWSTSQAAAVDQGGVTPWIFANDGLEETVIEALVSPPAGAHLLSAIADVGGFRHETLSSSPAAGTHAPTHGSNPGIDFAELVPTKVVRTHWGAARGALSLDGGTTWQDFPAAPAPAIANGPGVIAIAADGRRLVWLPKGSSPFFSTDDGRTWTASRTRLVSASDYRTTVPVADRVNPAAFYIYDGISGQMYKSTDGGVEFTAAAQLPGGGGLLRAAPDKAGQLWAPVSTGLLVSTNSGRTFQALSSVESAFQVGFGCTAPGKKSPTIYLSGRVQGVSGIFRSDDDGRSWTLLNTPQLQWGWIRVVIGDPRVYGRVYLGTSGRGILYGEPATP